MPPNDASESEEEDAGPSLPDASYKVNEAALSDDEREFARTMGFGDEGNEGAANLADVDTTDAPEPRASAEPESDPVPAESEASDAIEAASPDAEPEATTDESDEAAEANVEDETASAESPDEALDEIHSRSAHDSIQADIEAGVAALSDAPGAAPTDGPAPGQPVAANVAEIAALEAALAAALEEKKDDALESEIDGLCQERDQLVDECAALSSELGRSKARNEELTAALKNARSVLTPLPEGERALRAEVLGLRARLEENAREISGLKSELDAERTEMAIARARVHDREHELAVGAQARDELASDLEEQTREIAELRDRDRESIALCTRLQAENSELRSTQIALEETIEARDLELAAREEHLSVLREGLQARDLQTLEAQDQLDAAKQQAAALDSESSRQAITIRQLEDRIMRRDDRIAALLETLGEIENAIDSRRPGERADANSLSMESDATA